VLDAFDRLFDCRRRDLLQHDTQDPVAIVIGAPR